MKIGKQQIRKLLKIDMPRCMLKVGRQIVLADISRQNC
jgi:hypothetical protein